MDISREKPWSGISVDVDEKTSYGTMVYKLKLDQNLGGLPIPSKMPKNFANQETFRFCKFFFEEGDAHIETVGSMDKGRIIWALARLNEDITLLEDDVLKGYLLLSSRKEDRMSVDIQFLMIRSTCHITIPVSTKARDSIKNFFRREFLSTFPFMTPMVKDFNERTKKKAKEVFRLGREGIRTFKSDVERLVEKKIDESMGYQFMFEVFQPDTDLEFSGVEDKAIKEFAEKNTRIAIEAMHNAPGRNLQAIQWTAWDIFNAVAYTIDHHLSKNQESRLRLAWFGPNAKIKKRAFQLALEL